MRRACLIVACSLQFSICVAQLSDSSVFISRSPQSVKNILKEKSDKSHIATILIQSSVNKKDTGRKNVTKTAAISLAYTGVTYLTFRYFDTKIVTASQKNKTSFKSCVANSVSWMGLGRTQTIGLASTAAFSFLAKKKKLQKTVLIWGGSLVINSIITDQLKKSFQRHRPNSGDPYNTFDWRGGPKVHNSLPSAHTSNAFTTATVFATVYKENKWVVPVAYGLATLVGISRIYDNAHWASDVLAGAGVGFLSAKLMTYTYKLAGKKFTFLPNISKSYSTLSIFCSL